MNVSPRVITGPTVEPISLVEAKLHLRLDSDNTYEDAKITGLIKAAREYAENFTGRAFYKQTFEWVLDGWPLYAIDLPRATPLQSVTSVTYRDYSGIVNTLDPTIYLADVDAFPGRVERIPTVYWPLGPLFPSSPIKIRYVAGEDPAASPAPVFPEMVKVAMFMLLADWYMNREAEIVGNPAAAKSEPVGFGVDAILSKYVVGYAF